MVIVYHLALLYNFAVLLTIDSLGKISKNGHFRLFSKFYYFSNIWWFSEFCFVLTQCTKVVGSHNKHQVIYYLELIFFPLNFKQKNNTSRYTRMRFLYYSPFRVQQSVRVVTSRPFFLACFCGSQSFFLACSAPTNYLAMLITILSYIRQ